MLNQIPTDLVDSLRVFLLNIHFLKRFVLQLTVFEFYVMLLFSLMFLYRSAMLGDQHKIVDTSSTYVRGEENLKVCLEPVAKISWHPKSFM